MSAAKELTVFNAITKSLTCIFDDYNERWRGIQTIADFIQGKDELVDYFLSGNKVQSFMAKTMFEREGAVAALNSEFWQKTIGMTDVLECMPAEKRNEWSRMITDNKTPDFTPAIVKETITDLMLKREAFTAEKIAGLFSKLSGNHVTNSPMGFGKRMIIEYVLDHYGFLCHYRTEYLHDLRSVIAKLSGRDPSKTADTRSDLRYIVEKQQFGVWHTFDGGAFKVRIYKKGTAHMEIHPEIAAMLNRALAAVYPMNIASRTRSKDEARGKIIPLMNDMLSQEAIAALALAAKEGVQIHAYSYSHKNIQSVIDEVEHALNFIGGREVGHGWEFDYDPSEVLATIVRTGCLPERNSYQYFPTPAVIARRMVALAEIKPDHTVLEPSAGHGAIADHIPHNKKLVCIDISELNTKILRARGYQAIHGDFLTLNLFGNDRIIMNPPFADGQAERHLKRAAKLLTKEGRIVALLPASLAGKKLVPNMAHVYSPTFEGGFEDTKVRVTILVLTPKND